MKLEFKHLAPYLPYGLQIETCVLAYTGNPPEPSHDELGQTTLTLDNIKPHLEKGFRPILRPLSDLEEHIFLNGIDERVILVDYFEKYIDGWCDAYDEWWNSQYPDFLDMMKNCPYEIFEKLLEWHFDVFGLIEKGLAVDINTLE